MVALARTSNLDFSGCAPEEARAVVGDALAGDGSAVEKVYAGLAHKVWSLLVERRFDAEIRDWHLLVLQARSRARAKDGATAERMSALADLLAESVSMAQTSPAHEVVRRPNARRILNALRSGRFVSRRELLEKVGLKSAHLSNVLTQLLAHSVLERREKGKEAEFRLTAFGRELLDGNAPRTNRASTGLEDLVLELGRLSREPSTSWHSHIDIIHVGSESMSVIEMKGSPEKAQPATHFHYPPATGRTRWRREEYMEFEERSLGFGLRSGLVTTDQYVKL